MDCLCRGQWNERLSEEETLRRDTCALVRILLCAKHQWIEPQPEVFLTQCWTVPQKPLNVVFFSDHSK